MIILEVPIPGGATVPLAIDADVACSTCNSPAGGHRLGPTAYGGSGGRDAGLSELDRGPANREPERTGDINPRGDPP